ncbi:FtsX-like permease family protein [Pendulispora rubella]|uniref:FtsX-like permease family protein n=1 Tax=Pendulispora rubella TaxID=2741070 RepID=A0ABZ2L449_9BACT
MNSWRLAWRNLQRNRGRTAISLAALAVSTTLLIVLHGMVYGLDDLVTRGAVNLGVGEVEVHAKAYGLDQSIYATLPTAEAIAEQAKAQGIDTARRALGGGLLSSGEKSSGVRIWGVDPADERHLGKLPGHLKAGRYLPEANANRIVLGSELARLVGAKVGDRLAVIVQSVDASTSTEMMTVEGILESAGEQIDGVVAIIDRRDFDALFGTAGKVHEIALSSHFRLSEAQVAAIAQSAAGDAAEVQTWRELLPAVANVVNITRSSAGLFSFVFFAAAGLGLLNTMLMAASERIREFGILKALGATPWRILTDVAREAFLLGSVSACAGGAIGFGLVLILQRHGIDLSKFGKLSLSGVDFESVWRARPSLDGVLVPVLGMLLVTVVASLYPAWKASRLQPVKAIAHV